MVVPDITSISGAFECRCHLWHHAYSKNCRNPNLICLLTEFSYMVSYFLVRPPRLRQWSVRILFS